MTEIVDAEVMNRVVTSTELVDSKDLFGDWQALRARIATDGYVFLRSLLDPGTVREIGRTGLGHLQKAGWTEPGTDPVQALPLGPARAQTTAPPRGRESKVSAMGTPASPRKRPARERLLDAADRLFYEEGVHAVGIDRVLEQSGVAKGSLYYNFGSKDDLVRPYLQNRHAK